MNDHDRAQPVYMSGLISALPRLLTISGVLLCVCGMATLQGSLDLYVGIIERDWERTRPVEAGVPTPSRYVQIPGDRSLPFPHKDHGVISTAGPVPRSDATANLVIFVMMILMVKKIAANQEYSIFSVV